MIASDPALAGPRPAASPRPETRSAAEPASERRGDADFEAVLAGKPGRKAAPEAEAEAEVKIEAALPAPEAAAPVLAADTPLPGIPSVPVVVALPEAAVAPEIAAAPAPVLPVVAAAAVPTPAPPAAPVAKAAEAAPSPREAAPQRPEQPVAPQSAAPVAPVSVAQPVAAKPAPLPPAEPRLAAPEKEPEALPAAEAPTRQASAATAVAPLPSATAAMVATAASDTPGVVLRHDAAPPAWHLTAAPDAPARSEALALPQPVQPQAVVGQIAVAIGRAADRRVEIRLDPPELGRVQIHLTPVDGGVQAVVLADRPETQDLLRRHAEALARELGEAGYGTVSLDFAAGGETPAGRDEPRPDWAQATLGVAAPEAGPVAAAPRRAPAGGLDIRL